MTNPLCYQEDFMFMGSRAFEYYLPVIDRYLRECSGDDESDDSEAAIIGSGVAAQFDWNDSHLSKQAVTEIESLTVFVRANLSRYSPSPKAQRRIERAWSQVGEKIAKYHCTSKRSAAEQPPSIAP